MEAFAVAGAPVRAPVQLQARENYAFPGSGGEEGPGWRKEFGAVAVLRVQHTLGATCLMNGLLDELSGRVCILANTAFRPSLSQPVQVFIARLTRFCRGWGEQDPSLSL